MGLILPGERGLREREAELLKIRQNIGLSVGDKIRLRYAHRIAHDFVPGAHNEGSHGISYAEGTIGSIAYGEGDREGEYSYVSLSVSIPDLMMWDGEQIVFATLLRVERVQNGIWHARLKPVHLQNSEVVRTAVTIEQL